jgi:hypothetical protein
MPINDYYFYVSIKQWDLYLKHIVKGIYGVEEGNDRIIYERNGMRRVEIKVNSQIPLINSLPFTIRKSNENFKYYAGEKVDIVEIFIKEAILDYIRPGGTFHSQVKLIAINLKELKDIIYQLALDNKISKFVSILEDKFIVYIYISLSCCSIN